MIPHTPEGGDMHKYCFLIITRKLQTTASRSTGRFYTKRRKPIQLKCNRNLVWELVWSWRCFDKSWVFESVLEMDRDGKAGSSLHYWGFTNEKYELVQSLKLRGNISWLPWPDQKNMQSRSLSCTINIELQIRIHASLITLLPLNTRTCSHHCVWTIVLGVGYTMILLDKCYLPCKKKNCVQWY